MQKMTLKSYCFPGRAVENIGEAQKVDVGWKKPNKLKYKKISKYS